jgi:hypothetical protein
MYLRSCILAGLLLGSFGAGAAVAQTPDSAATDVDSIAAPLAPGTRVRLRGEQLRPARTIVGTLVARPDSLWRVERDGFAGALALPAAHIDRAEVSTRRRARTLRGTLLGAGLGVTLGLLFAETQRCDDCDHAGIRRRSLLIGTGAGTALGLLYGVTARRDTWAPIATY